MSERQRQERDALSAHRSYGTRALRLPNTQKSLHFVVGLAYTEAHDQRRHRRRRIVGLDHRRDSRRTVRKSCDGIAIGSRERGVGDGLRIRRWRNAARARPIAHGAERFAAAANVRVLHGGGVPAATRLDNGNMTGSLAAVILAIGEANPQAGKAAGDKN